MNFADRLDAAVQAKQSPLVVGLDPFLDRLPAPYAVVRDPDASRADRAQAVGDFLCAVIEVVADRVPAVKPQSAFFEVLGADGIQAWERVVAAARSAGLLVIGDAKRGDIGSTATAYAEAFLTGGPGLPSDSLCDCLTVNPYLGSDSIEPFLTACHQADAGLFVLLRTSNPGSAEFQNHGDPPLTHVVSDAVSRWGSGLIGASGLSSIGAVVGATHPSELIEMRARMPHTPFLLPGFGAQGADAKDVAHGFTKGLSGAVVNSSRAILFAGHGDDWRDATSRAVDETNDALRGALGVTQL